MAYIATYKDGSGETTYPQTKMEGVIDLPTDLLTRSVNVENDFVATEVSSGHQQTGGVSFTINGNIVIIQINFTTDSGTNGGAKGWSQWLKVAGAANLVPAGGDVYLRVSDSAGTNQRLLAFSVSGSDLILSVLGAGVPTGTQMLGTLLYLTN